MASSSNEQPCGRLGDNAENAVPMATTSPDGVTTVGRPAVIAVFGFSLIAAAVSAFRAASTGLDDGSTGVVLAATASLLAVAGAVAAFRSLRLAALPLAVALLMELVVLNEYVDVAPPRLVNAIPLMFALALAIVASRSSTERSRAPESRQRRVAAIVALVLMVPIGFGYLATGLVAPFPDVYAAYALFTFLLGGAVWLTHRRSWWVVAVPIVSVGLWSLMFWAGDTYLDWSP